MRKIISILAVLIGVASSYCLAANAAKSAELLMFESKLCEWCDKWREEIGAVYPKTDEGRIAPLRTIDVYQTRPNKYAPIKGIVYTPTFVLWHDGGEVGRILGYSGEAFFWGLLGELIEDMQAGRGAAPKATEPPAAPVSGTRVPAANSPNP